MKILVTGANGMLGSSLCPELQHLDYNITKTNIKSGDKSVVKFNICDFAQIQKYIANIKPEIIFHLAAETDLDLCEKNPEHAYQVNVKGTENIARICQEYNILMIYISTGHVFDGEKQESYIESDKPNPINVYGQTKLEGEKIVQDLLDKYFIFRASWMVGGGAKDKKFVGKIISLIKDNIKEIKAVDDKFGSPTFANDFAHNIMPVVLTGRYGIYHMANKGSCSRFELAQKIVQYLNKDEEVKVQATSSDMFPLIAPRPRSERLHNYNLERLGLNNMPHWEQGLRKYLDNINTSLYL